VRVTLILKQGQELWVEVTAPVSGPPRPIQLALSDSTGFYPLHLNSGIASGPACR